MTPTENASEASEKRALWRVERHARWGKCKTPPPTSGVDWGPDYSLTQSRGALTGTPKI